MGGDERWAQILAATTPPVGNWIDLPENLRSTLVAFAAGPGRVRATPVRAGTGRVRVEVITPGLGTRRFERPLDDEDVAELYDSAAGYAREAGIEPPPGLFRWSLLAPEGLTADEFERRLNVLQEQGGEEMTTAEYASRIAALVAALVGAER